MYLYSSSLVVILPMVNAFCSLIVLAGKNEPPQRKRVGKHCYSARLPARHEIWV